MGAAARAASSGGRRGGGEDPLGRLDLPLGTGAASPRGGLCAWQLPLGLPLQGGGVSTGQCLVPEGCPAETEAGGDHRKEGHTGDFCCGPGPPLLPEPGGDPRGAHCLAGDGGPNLALAPRENRARVFLWGV